MDRRLRGVMPYDSSQRVSCGLSRVHDSTQYICRRWQKPEGIWQWRDAIQQPRVPRYSEERAVDSRTVRESILDCPSHWERLQSWVLQHKFYSKLLPQQPAGIERIEGIHICLFLIDPQSKPHNWKAANRSGAHRRIDRWLAQTAWSLLHTHS